VIDFNNTKVDMNYSIRFLQPINFSAIPIIIHCIIYLRISNWPSTLGN